MTSHDTDALIDEHDYFAAMNSGSKAERVFHPARLKLITEMAPWRNKKVLELGSGTGCVAIPLAERGAEVTAVELSEAHLEQLGLYAQERGLSIERVQADARDLPFEDSSFDIVVLASLVHLIPRTGSLLREAERVCRSEGRVLIAGPWQRHPKSSRRLKTLLRGGKAPDGRKHQPFNEKLLKQLMTRSTFLSSRYNYPIGYWSALFMPDRKVS